MYIPVFPGDPFGLVRVVYDRARSLNNVSTVAVVAGVLSLVGAAGSLPFASALPFGLFLLLPGGVTFLLIARSLKRTLAALDRAATEEIQRQQALKTQLAPTP